MFAGRPPGVRLVKHDAEVGDPVPYAQRPPPNRVCIHSSVCKPAEADARLSKYALSPHRCEPTSPNGSSCSATALTPCPPAEGSDRTRTQCAELDTTAVRPAEKSSDVELGNNRAAASLAAAAPWLGPRTTGEHADSIMTAVRCELFGESSATPAWMFGVGAVTGYSMPRGRRRNRYWSDPPGRGLVTCSPRRSVLAWSPKIPDQFLQPDPWRKGKFRSPREATDEAVV